MVEQCEIDFEFDMHRDAGCSETPRVTKPYTDGAVAGHPGDRRAGRSRAGGVGDVRLTMGGEPTFVAATDIDAPEWNTDALGPTKQRLRRASCSAG